MPDSMMRICGRDSDGNAQAIATESDGKLLTYLNGSNVAYGDDPRGLVPITEPTLLTIPTYDGSGQATHPSVVYFPRKWNNYNYWMAMTPYPNANDDYENPSILASDDGITWVEPAGITNPIFPMPVTGNYSDVHLEYDYATNKLVIYWQHNVENKYYRSDSSNGVTWSDKVEVTGIGTSPSVIKTGTTGTNWVGFIPALNGGMYRVRSTDGTAFTHPALVSMRSISQSAPSGQIGHSWVGIDDIGWHALLTVAPDNRLWSDCQLYYAFSPNGWDWTMFPAPLIGRNQGMTGGYNIYRSCMVNIGDRMRVYYSVMTPANENRIGYMDVKIGFTNTRRYNGCIEIPLFRGLQVRDELPVPGTIDPDEWNNYTNKSIVYTNSHDVDMRLNFVSNFRGSLSLTTNSDNLYNYVAGTPALSMYKLPVGSANIPVVITKSDLPILGHRIPGGITLQAIRWTGAAPTSGELNMTLLMWND